MTTGMKQTVIKQPGWWRRRTSLERRLTILTGAIGIAAVALAIALTVIVLIQQKVIGTTASDNGGSIAEALNYNQPAIIAVNNSYVKGEENICYSSGCVHTASRLLSYMDDAVDPCDDFYEFACGQFDRSTRIPDDKASVNTFSIIQDKLQEQIRTLLDEPVSQNEPTPFLLAKTFYQACMNRTLIEERGTVPLISMLRHLGGWPLLDGDRWDENSFHWINSVYKFRAAGYSVDYFIDFSIGVDVKNSTNRVIDLDQASLGLSREYLNRGISDRLVTAYYEYMVDISVILGANRDRAQRELKESLEFEMKLANISLPQEKRRNATNLYNPMTVKTLQEKYPSIPWLTYINTLLAPHVIIGEDEMAIVNVPKYISDLEELLGKTPKRVQANYVMWRVVSASVSYLTEELRKRQLQFATALTGKTERESRWKECADTVSGSLSLAVGAQYIKKYFNEDSKATALEMVNDIRAQFRHILLTVDWMDETTRKAALAKADSMTAHIAYPQEMLDVDKLTDFYKNLDMSPDKLMESVLNLTLFGTDYSFSRLRKPVNKSDWVNHGRPAVVNAFYSSLENSIQFPAGILQGAFFSANRPKYMNYGAIGFVIGHEITHGFDDQGRQFDKEGNLVDWWEESTKLRYLEKARCIIDQYSNYTAKEVSLNLNGVNTQGENIADNGGIKEAYLAYNEWVKRNGEEKRLPGLKYTPRQLFWLSAANTWCSVYRKEALKLRITTGFHSPGRFRVIGPLSNMDYFAEDYKCPPGSPMNPQHKCRVW